MNHEFARALWLAALIALLSFAVYTFFGALLAALEEGDPKEVVLRDLYKGDAHEISGFIMVPSDCHELRSEVFNLGDETVAVVFETWKQPYRDCPLEPTPRAFDVVAFADKDVQFASILDGEWLRVFVIKETDPSL